MLNYRFSRLLCRTDPTIIGHHMKFSLVYDEKESYCKTDKN